MGYSPEQIEEKFALIIKDIEENNMPIRRAVKGYGMPDITTFYKWIEEDEEKAKRYARACDTRAENLFEEILDIADDSNPDVTYDNDGNVRIDGQAIQRSKLRIEARQWVLGKLNPKKYGTKVQNEISGDLNVNLKDMVRFDNTKQ